MTLPETMTRERALQLLDPDRRTTAREEDLAAGDLFHALKLAERLGRPLWTIGAREYTRWRAVGVVEAAQALVEDYYRKR